MNLSPIKKKRVYQNIIDQIKLSIEEGELQPGERLPSERDLAEMLSVSRSAVREAISVLESLGVVSIAQGRGVFLREDSSQALLARMNESVKEAGLDLVELLEVRQGIESQAAYLAALHRTDSNMRSIYDAFIQLEKAVRTQKIAAREDYQFHYAIVKASRNKLLMKAVKLFSDKSITGLNKSRSETIKIPGKSEIVLEEHFRIYEAIEKQDPFRAQQEMWKHLQNVKDRYLSRSSLT